MVIFNCAYNSQCPISLVPCLGSFSMLHSEKRKVPVCKNMPNQYSALIILLTILFQTVQATSAQKVNTHNTFYLQFLKHDRGKNFLSLTA